MYLDMYRKTMDSMTHNAVYSAHIFPMNGTMQVIFSVKSNGVKADHPTEMDKKKKDYHLCTISNCNLLTHVSGN